jgi:tripartite-type tricarboxylate transporter receptor subunit TctC
MRIPRHLLLFTLLAPICCASALGNAEDISAYPSRPIKVIVPVGAGAGIDNAARITAEAVEKHLGQRLVVENKPGAGMRIGASFVAKSPPDGYTLMFTAPAPVAATEHFPPKIDYDPAHDFRPVVIAVWQPVLLIVRPSLGVKTAAEFVDYAKRNPGKLSFGVQGLTGEMRLTLEIFKKEAGVDITHIPYNSGAQAIVDLLADRLDAMFLVIPPIKGHVDSGKLLALATLNDKRLQQFPNLPTMIELGLPNVTNAVWFGYLAPAQTPQPIIDKLAGAFAKLQSDAALVKRIADLGAQLDIVGPTEFGKIIEQDRSRYGKIVAERNLAKPN